MKQVSAFFSVIKRAAHAFVWLVLLAAAARIAYGQTTNFSIAVGSGTLSYQEQVTTSSCPIGPQTGQGPPPLGTLTVYSFSSFSYTAPGISQSLSGSTAYLNSPGGSFGCPATGWTTPLPLIFSETGYNISFTPSLSGPGSATIVSTSTITSISPTSGQVGTAVTITGTNFGATQGSSAVTFNGTAAAVSSWSNTSIAAIVPSGASSGNVVVTISGLPTNGVSFTVLVPPSISSISPASDPVDRAVTIAGSNFGSTQGSSTVAFNGTAASVSSWSNTSIVAIVPSAASSGNVVVTVGGMASNGFAFTVLPTPSISSLSPSSGVAGTSVTITGTNFGSSQGSSTVTFSGIAVTVSSWSNTSIVAAVPSGSSTGSVIVTVSGVVSNAVTFTVPLSPSISSLSPSSGAWGSSVTISGANFGSSQGSGTVQFSGVAAAISSWSNTSIAAIVPSGITSGSVVVTVNGLVSNAASFTIPGVYSLSVGPGTLVFLQQTTTSSCPIGSGAPPPLGTLTVTSFQNFTFTASGSTQSLNGGFAFISSPGGSFGCPAGGWTTTIPAVLTGTGFTILFTPTIGGAGSATYVLTPSISGVSPTSGTVGTSVTITGSNFGSTQGSSSVTFNGTAATVSSWSNTSIVATVPSGATTGNVVVTATGVASNGVAFTVIPTPTISSLSPTSGPVGGSVTITGTNFGSTQGSSTVMFNGTTATVISWSATSIVAAVPAGATSGNVVVTVNGIASNGIAFTVLPTPTISSLSPTSGQAGTLVTITGTNFGSTQGSSVVRVNGTAATVSSWSATSIVAAVPSGATSGNVTVTVSGVVSNGVSFTVLVAPSISSISPSSGSWGSSVTITGANFGSTQGSSTVKFSGVTAAVSSWSNTSIVAVVPSGITTGSVAVTVNGLTSNGVTFTVQGAYSLSVGPGTLVFLQQTTTGSCPVGSDAPPPMGTLTVTSFQNFTFTASGSTQSLSGGTAYIVSPGGNFGCPASGWQSAIPVVLTGSGFTILFTPTVGAAGSATYVPTPAISSLSPTSGPVGSTVTITGTNFGSTQGSSTVTFNGKAATVSSWSASSIVATVPSGATSGNVVVTVSTVAANGVTFTVLPTPTISSISPTSGVIGTSVTITGTNFSPGSSTVKFNSTAATVTSSSATSIVVVVPAGIASGATTVTVTVNGVVSNGVTFTVLPTPSITSLSPTSGPVTSSVTITGTNFGSTQGSSTVKFNGTAATVSTWSSTSIVAIVPNGATTGNVVVTENGIVSNGVTFTVLATPVITSLSPISGAPGSSVTITGLNFGATQGTSTVTFNGKTATIATWSNTSIVATVPSGATTGNVVVTVNGVSSAGSSFGVTGGTTPTIASLTPAVGPVGTTVTIAGTNFGATQGTSTVTFNGTAATVTTWSASSIVTTVPTGATTGNVVVTVSGAASNGALFTVQPPPSITSLNPTSAVTGASLTITGTNFGATQGSSTVTFNGTAATVTTWSNTSIVVPVPAAATTGNVVVTVSGVASNGSPFTVLPNISGLSFTQGPVGMGVTITGTGFGSAQGTVTFNGTAATTIVTWSNTSVIAQVPANATSGNVVVKVGNNSSTGVAFQVIPSIPCN